MKYNASPQRIGNQSGIEQSFYRDSKCHLQKSKPTSMHSLSLLFQANQVHLQGALTSYHRSIEGGGVSL